MANNRCLFEMQRVYIIGEVKKPGRYPRKIYGSYSFFPHLLWLPAVIC